MDHQRLQGAESACLLFVAFLAPIPSFTSIMAFYMDMACNMNLSLMLLVILLDQTWTTTLSGRILQEPLPVIPEYLSNYLNSL